MTTVSTDGLQGIAANVLERMAFVFTEESVLTPQEVLDQCTVHSLVELSGSKRFTVSVSLTPGMVQEVASGMMGCDAAEVDPEEHGKATAAELSNVIGGELIMLMGGNDGSLHLGLPREVTEDEAGRLADAAHRQGLTCAVDCESGSLLVTFRAD